MPRFDFKGFLPYVVSVKAGTQCFKNVQSIVLPYRHACEGSNPPHSSPPRLCEKGFSPTKQSHKSSRITVTVFERAKRPQPRRTGESRCPDLILRVFFLICCASFFSINAMDTCLRRYDSGRSSAVFRYNKHLQASQTSHPYPNPVVARTASAGRSNLIRVRESPSQYSSAPNAPNHVVLAKAGAQI